MIGEPEVTYRKQRLTMGIRTIAPFRGMLAERDALLRELRGWVQAQGLDGQGPYFLRLHVIDMAGQMDIEVGYVVADHVAWDGRVTPGVLPAGSYASLTYSRYALRANKALLEWARKRGLRLDRWDDSAGDAFRCRYEAYLTDYRVEPRKSKWAVELAIRLADS